LLQFLHKVSKSSLRRRIKLSISAAFF